MFIFTVTYLKIPLQVRLDRQTAAGQAASHIEGFTVEKKLGFIGGSVINLLAES